MDDVDFNDLFSGEVTKKPLDHRKTSYKFSLYVDDDLITQCVKEIPTNEILGNRGTFHFHCFKVEWRMI